MKKYTLIIILIIITKFSFAQNLVPNPSFEEYITCPNNLSQIYYANNWNSYGGTPDYWNKCNGYVPNTGFGYQFPATGNSFAGFYLRLQLANNVREFIGCKLITPLKIGHTYHISFNANLSFFDSSNCAINNIGVLFSNNSYNENLYAPIVNYAHIYSKNIISDTLNWTTVTGSFVADSNYTDLIIGNFFDIKYTDTLQIGNKQCISYYFIDDICVSENPETCPKIQNIKDSKFVNINISNINNNKIIVNNSVNTELLNFKIYDILGNLLYFDKIYNNEINISNLSKGLYIINIYSKKFYSNFKFIKS